MAQHAIKRRKFTRPISKPKKIKDTSLQLHEVLSEEELVALQEAFNKEHMRRMDKCKLKQVLNTLANIEYDEHKYDILFRRMDDSCDGYVTWDEFISYLIIGFQQQEISQEYKSLEDPISTPPKMIKSDHRYSISKIAFYPTIKPDRSTTWQDGSIITCSQDGTINYWSLGMHLEKTVQSTCPLLKVHTTWITDMVVMADVCVICTSSTERDLRFYDTSARKFELRVMMSSLPTAVTSMYYTFDKDINIPSKLVLGDMTGSVRVMFFKTEARGIFKSQPRVVLLHVRYERIVKGLVQQVTVVEYPHLHTDFVRQVYYYDALHAVASCAQCPNALRLTDVTESKTNYTYRISSGAWCFAVADVTHIVATGGPDCTIRIWNPWLPEKPTFSLYGHHYGIIQMTFQDNGEKLYSMSKDKWIKVWDIGSQRILQTYIGLVPQLGDRSDFTTLYNPQSRQLIIGGGVAIAVLPLSPKQCSDHTDGNTHTSGVSVVLYNKLFKCLVTCSLDSYIISWDPWDGRRFMVVKEAHTVVIHGEVKSVEITAATFDPGYQRLLTGAHDGTLKIWNFNTGTCLRHMTVEKWCEIQAVIWVKGRILATGWNKQITEFSDTGEAIGVGGAYSKVWSLHHNGDVSSAVVRVPEAVATSSYVGELILWRLETGHAYRKFNVSNPTLRIKIQYQLDKSKEKVKDEYIYTRAKSSSTKEAKRESIQRDYYQSPFSRPRPDRIKHRRVSIVALPQECLHLRKLAVHCMLFLNTRKTELDIGTLLVALENGIIQVWSHHITGGFITSFSAIHKAGDYVISMTADVNDEFLFVGTTTGYIKTWLLKNYCVLPEDKEYICMPKYRLMFPFMWGDTFVGRAARMAANQPRPVLLNSYKGHIMPVTGITYIDDCQIIISCSADYSARMWTLGGRYIQTIGTFKPYKRIEPDEPIDQHFQYTIPPDIKKVASSTTLRVLSGGSLPKRLTWKQAVRRAQKNLFDVDEGKIYGRPLQKPVLGEYYAIPERTTKPKFVEFDTSFPYIPVYQHLIMPQHTEIKKPKMPGVQIN